MDIPMSEWLSSGESSCVMPTTAVIALGKLILHYNYRHIFKHNKNNQQLSSLCLGWPGPCYQQLGQIYERKSFLREHPSILEKDFVSERVITKRWMQPTFRPRDGHCGLAQTKKQENNWPLGSIVEKYHSDERKQREVILKFCAFAATETNYVECWQRFECWTTVSGKNVDESS